MRWGKFCPILFVVCKIECNFALAFPKRNILKELTKLSIKEYGKSKGRTG